MRRSEKRSNAAIFISLLVLVGLVGLIVWNFRTISQYFSEERGGKEETSLEQRLKALEEQVAALKAGPETNPKLEEALVPEAGHGMPQEYLCPELEQKLIDLFNYLDGREAIAAYKLPEGIRGYLKETTGKLFVRPPTVIRETDSLTIVLNNAAHFYRVLGERDIAIARKILTTEGDIIESSLALFYRWLEMEEQCNKTVVDIHLPLDQLYEYAVFFVNTMGGNSYLFRRTPQVRTLIRYYVVLILDQVNGRNLNRYGIDIRPTLIAVVQEIQSLTNLLYKEKYLQTLQGLAQKYQIKYGGLEDVPTVSRETK